MKIFGRERDTATQQTAAAGAMVRTTDGIALGRTGATRAGYFEVIPEDEGRYWLSTLYLKRSDAVQAELTIAFSELDAHRLHEPGLNPGLASEGEARDRVLSDEEALMQREHMERELREQRGTIDTGLHS